MRGYLLNQLAYHSPVLLVCLVGMTLSLIFLQRAKVPALLTLIGAGLWLIVTVAVVAIQFYMIESRMSSGLSGASYGQWTTVVSMIGSALRAVALGLIIAAVFVGRSGHSAPRA